MKYQHDADRAHPMYATRRCRWLCVLAVPALFSFSGCGHQATVASQKPAIDVAEVSVASPVRRSIHYVVLQPGRIDPYEQTPIYTKIPGFVRSVRVNIGDRVKKGDLLVELDVPEMDEALHAREALVTQARLGMAQAEQSVAVIETGLATSQAEVEVAQAGHERTSAASQRWASESRRMKRLVQDKVVDTQSLEEMQNQSRSAEAANNEAPARNRGAKAALAETRARLGKAKADLNTARNQLSVAQAEERQSRAMVAYSRLLAPFDGVIADRQVDTGHFLNAATGGTKGGPLLVVVRTDPVRVFVDVPEADAVRVAQGNTGRIRVQTLNDREFQGTVTGTSWALDRSQRTLRTEIDLANSTGVLRPGMYVHSLIDVEHANAWVIPASAILVRDQSTFCYQVRNGKTHRLPVRLGLRSGPLVETAKIEGPPTGSTEVPSWIDPDGHETIIVAKPGELMDEQEVRIVRG